MKITYKSEKPQEFQPVVITIKIETKEELIQLHSDIGKMTSTTTWAIYDSLQEQYPFLVTRF